MKKLSWARFVLSAACAATALLIGVNVGPNSAARAAGGGWGSVTGQFVLDGTAPKLAPKVAKGDASAKDAAVCAAEGVPNEDLVVDPKSHGIANIFVYLKKAPKVHPDLKASKEKKVPFDQKGCRFIPHTLFVRTDQVVNVLSDDPVAHNTNVQPVRNTPFNSVIKVNERNGVEVKFSAPESLPTQVKCDLHPWMKAYWLILDHPYAAITDADGKFTIKDLPAGDHEFIVWQEGAGYVDRKYKVKVEAGKTTELKPVKVPLSKLKS